MCGRYVIISKLKTIEKRFRTKPLPPDLFESSPNISIGNYAPVITNEQPDEVQLFQFGLTPFWAKKTMYFFNARSEGDHNKEDDPKYTGAMGIVKKPAFRHCIRQKRCLIIADAFIEGPKKEKLSKPFLVYLRDGKRPFALAGIWDKWINKETAEVIHSFSIITTVANALLREIGHHRSPVILPEELETTWLEDIPLAEVTDMLRPYPSEEMNAYPISPAIKNPRMKEMALLQPTGERIYKEYNYDIVHELKLEGMGMSQARIRKNEEETDTPETPKQDLDIS
jgi:putative SOS response-associated peptidase YedK